MLQATDGFTIEELIPMDQHDQQRTENKTQYYWALPYRCGRRLSTKLLKSDLFLNKN